jgi:hypothetical protein
MGRSSVTSERVLANPGGEADVAPLGTNVLIGLWYFYLKVDEPILAGIRN